MLIRVRNIPEEGMDVSLLIPPSVMKEGLRETDEAYQVFGNEIACDLHLDVNKKDVYVSGQAETAIRPICSRCDEAFDRRFMVDVSLTCSPGKAPKGSDTYQESDEGIIFYRREEINLTEIIREQVLLSLPIKYLCSETCLGLCADCGVNMNEGPHECQKKQMVH